jgi:hypothetical protein
VVQVVFVEDAGQVCQLSHGGLRPRRVAHGDGPVESGDRRGREVQQHVVQQDDLLPVGVLPALGLGVTRDDRGLKLVRAGAMPPGGASEQAGRFRDSRPIPG